MIYEFNSFFITAESETEKAAGEILREEFALRKVTGTGNNTLNIIFKTDNSIEDKDEYRIDSENNTFVFSARGIRGLIFAVGEFLRSSEYIGGKITVVKDITGRYSPYMKIRGHQMCYGQMSNTYDAWDICDYIRYYKDLMFFGANTVELITYSGGRSNCNELMKYDEVELAALASAEADKLDLDVSLWMSNCEKNFDEALKLRERVFSSLCRIDAVFTPGGDPGDLDAEEMFERSRAYYSILKKYHPNAKIWPSAQEPRGKENWGENFIAELSKGTGETGGIIQGPNRAFTTDELRRKVPQEYPLRFYPDITHNVRCEHPVHFLEDDWNYALCTVNGRESFNPRPVEYAKLHKLNYKYFIGSVSYSEGVNDDVNKALWSALDFNPDKPVNEIIEEYARLFFYGMDTNKVARGLLALEKNWEGRPEENPSVEYAYDIFSSLENEYPSAKENWRFVLCLLRATTDKFAKDKLVFENGLIADAKHCIKKGNLSEAEKILRTFLPDEIKILRSDIDSFAEMLFRLIGMQIGTKDYHALSWERGAILDIIDLPISDVQVLLNKLDSIKDKSYEVASEFMQSYINRNKVVKDEFYYSFALNELYALGVRQSPDFYMDFQGDRPDKNKGNLPVCCFKVYDHFSLKCRTAGFTPGTDYILMISYLDCPDKNAVHHKITANGHVIYDGPQFGGERNTAFEKDMLPEGYAAVMYKLPASVFENGCLDIEISEPLSGFKLSEFRITKEAYKSSF